MFLLSRIGRTSSDIGEGIGSGRMTARRRCRSRNGDHLPEPGARSSEPELPIADKSPTMGMEKHAQLAPSQKENLAKSTTSRGVMPAMTVSWDMP